MILLLMTLICLMSTSSTPYHSQAKKANDLISRQFPQYHDESSRSLSKDRAAEEAATGQAIAMHVAFNTFELEEEITSKGFHDLYLQRDGMEFMTPIVFEDGMDFTECELYYVSMKAQDTGGSFRVLGLLERQSSLCEFRKHQNLLEPCLRNPKRSLGERSGSQRKVRRCSFGGLPRLDGPYKRPVLTKANSHRSFLDHKPTVAFEEYVQVVTIHPIDDLPIDVRSRMWMSRKEMLQCMRGAAAERLQKHVKLMNERANEP